MEMTESLAIEFIDQVRQAQRDLAAILLIPGTRRTLAQRLSIHAGSDGIETTIQIFAGYLTEHTMGIVREGGAKRGEIQDMKIPATRGELVERNGNDLPS